MFFAHFFAFVFILVAADKEGYVYGISNTGFGKSTWGNAMTNTNAFKEGPDALSCTTSFQCEPMFGSPHDVCDTVGFGNNDGKKHELGGDTEGLLDFFAALEQNGFVKAIALMNPCLVKYNDHLRGLFEDRILPLLEAAGAKGVAVVLQHTFVTKKCAPCQVHNRN